MSDEQVLSFVAAAARGGVKVQVFGLSRDNARAFWNWQFLPAESGATLEALPQTTAMLMRACDVRMPCAADAGRAGRDWGRVVWRGRGRRAGLWHLTGFTNAARRRIFRRERRRSTAMTPSRGRCLCGKTRFSFDAQCVVHQWLCHCENCRRATSARWWVLFSLPDTAWRWTGATPATFSPARGQDRGFCGTCGSPMMYRTADSPDHTTFYAPV